MSERIAPSDSYIQFLVPPVTQPAPDYIKNALPEYRITHILGSGGFADVYEGSDPDGWGVAIKVPQFKMGKTIDSSVLEKFALEAEIWKKLDHEHIVNLFASSPRPIPHIIMELMEGGDLEGLMKNHKLTVGEAVRIMLQVLEGMSYAHRMASVHRDLKPENILFTREGVAKITDWGIGKYMASEGITKTIETKGTLAYSAPEQYDSRKYGKVDWQTDIFQLGIVFYEMLTGVKPFEGRDIAEIMGKVITYDPEPPSSLNPDVPEELDEIIMGALEKDRKKRWDSGAVMLFQLKGVVEGKGRVGKKVERKETGEKGQSEGVMRELEKQFGLLRKIGVDTSGLEREIKPIKKYARLRWYHDVVERGNVLLKELKERYQKELERKDAERKRLMEDVKKLFKECLSHELDIKHLYDMNDEAMKACENKDFNRAEKLFLNLKKELEGIIHEEQVRRLKEEVEILNKTRERYDIELKRIDAALKSASRLFIKGAHKEAGVKYIHIQRRINNAIQLYEKETEQRLKKQKEQVHRLKKEVGKLNIKRRKHNIEIKGIREGLQSAYTLLKEESFQRAEDKYRDIKICLEDAVNEYETDQKAIERVRIRAVKRKRRIAITSIAVVVLLVGSGIGGYVWYYWDSDDDGIRDAEDAFPNDPAAAIDSDGDGYPDKWNEGKTQSDSTTGLHLDYIPNVFGTSYKDIYGYPDRDKDGYSNWGDNFPDDPAASLDTDDDGYPDEWNEGKSWIDSTTDLKLDELPNEPTQWKDSDGDGFGDNSSDVNGDAFPNNPTVWADNNKNGIDDNYEDVITEDINGTTFYFVNISVGSFNMGSWPGEGGNDECPQHYVTISQSFQMLIFEVTQSKWKAIMGSNPSSFIGDSNPVDSVSWNDCQSFISKLNELDPDYIYRLPTEAEWEYACRAGRHAMYCFGNDENELSSYGWYIDNSNNKTHPVGLLKPNVWGLYDMHGNVWEWCQDDYHSSYTGAPTDGSSWGDGSGLDRVFRGGGWDSVASYCRSQNRADDYPHYLNVKRLDVGLRLVRIPDEDGDDVDDYLDDFPDDPSASLDSDRDGYPDLWNEGKNATDSTKGLTIDQFPDDPKLHSVDTMFDWVNISSGTFMMGDPTGEGDYDEDPQHHITISRGFQIAKYEVTQAQWEVIMGSNPSSFSGDNNPVEQVSWNECQSFISKLNELDPDHAYRIPTEAEWEYVCRAGSTTKYGYGNDSGQLGNYAWYDGNSNRTTHPVGQKTPNAWGLYDMHGNVWEWCQDWYDSDYYDDSPDTDPQGPTSGSSRVVRGGCWSYSADQCSSASRGHGNPNYPDYGPDSFGVRLVLEKDTDGDGVFDNDDTFPNDPTEIMDTDGDGYGDNKADKFPDNSDEWADDDGDGYGDNRADKFPGNSDEWADEDNDGHGDNKDDKFPNNPTVWADSDEDGIADEYENAVETISINNVTFTFVSISPGTFTMGSPDGEGFSDEHPQHQVTISKGFQILKFEVTQAQWESIMGSNPSSSLGDSNPVELVNWNDAKSFISKLNELDLEYTYRLPTEAEWEYTARAGSDTKYSYGNNENELSTYGWYCDNSNDTTHPVGLLKPNAWGLYDMHGNVGEWCQDWYDNDYYENSPGMDPQGPNSGSSRVIRGGGGDAVFCRSANRSSYAPDGVIYGIGLRLIREEA